MKTTEIIENLSEWRDEFKKGRHPVTLTLNAAITHLQELHDLLVRMAAFTGKRPIEIEALRETFSEWETMVERATGTSFFDSVTKYEPITLNRQVAPLISPIIRFADQQPPNDYDYKCVIVFTDGQESFSDGGTVHDCCLKSKIAYGWRRTTETTIPSTGPDADPSTR